MVRLWERNDREPLVWYVRILLFIAGAGAITLLLTAARLTPNSDGFGTHRQLGLEPCSFIQWFGIRCPACGMTTSWSHFTHGEIGSALESNVAGVMLAVVAAVGGLWSLITAVTGRWFLGRPNEWLVVAVTCMVMITALAQWIFRLSPVA